MGQSTWKPYRPSSSQPAQGYRQPAQDNRKWGPLSPDEKRQILRAIWGEGMRNAKLP